MSHTPGPWRPYFYVRNQRLKIGDWGFVQEDGYRPVPLKDTRREVSESAANACLIAAAPDLLEACEELLIYLADWDDPDNETCVKARAAIAKAKGGE